MTADELIAWLETDRSAQRDKLATLRTQRDAIVALADDDHRRAYREIKKRLNSPKLATEIQAFLVDIARTYPPPPEPAARPPIVVPAGVDPREAELRAAIDENPRSHELYLVYGDYLMSIGDPFGEWMAHGANREQIMGKLAGCDDLLTNVAWRHGFITTCRASYTNDRFNQPVTATIPDVLDWLLDNPGPGRFLEELTVGMVMHDDQHYTGVVEVLARRVRPTLRKLALGDFESDECELNWSSIDLAKLWPNVPNLRELWLRSGSITVGAIDLPHLETLETISGGMSATTVGAIANARWPALQRLSLMVGLGHQGAATDFRLVEPLLGATRAPKLTHLGIMNCEFTDDLCALLVDAPLTRQLTTLDLSMGTMSDEGAAMLAANATKFAHLRLVLDDNYIGPAGAAALATAFGIRVTGQREDDGDRRASMYE